MGKIVFRDGKCYVRDDFPALYSDPYDESYYYRLPEWDRYTAFDGVGARIERGGVVVVVWYGSPSYHRLASGGDTVADIYDRTDIPCPRVRKGTETRFIRGAWEKRLAKGWVPA